MPTGAQVIVEQLEDAGVEVCFGLPGVHNLPLWEAIRASGIRLIGVRHEQAAAYAADGYARATGKLGVALTTTGPGAANTVNASCPQDLSLMAFPVGACSRTILGKAEILLLRTGEDAFRVECWRSFSDYVLTFLEDAAKDAAA